MNDFLNFLEVVLNSGSDLGQILDAFFLYKLITLSSESKKIAKDIDGKAKEDLADLKKCLHSVARRISRVEKNSKNIFEEIKRENEKERQRREREGSYLLDSFSDDNEDDIFEDEDIFDE